MRKQRQRMHRTAAIIMTAMEKMAASAGESATLAKAELLADSDIAVAGTPLGRESALRRSIEDTGAGSAASGSLFEQRHPN